MRLSFEGDYLSRVTNIKGITVWPYLQKEYDIIVMVMMKFHQNLVDDGSCPNLQTWKKISLNCNGKKIIMRLNLIKNLNEL